MNGTKITAGIHSQYFVEEHRNTITRYYNGRKYTVQTHHDFYQRMTEDFPIPAGYCFAVYFRYVTVGSGSRKVGRVYNSFHNTHPTNLQRAMVDLIPDDMQAVPF